MLIFEKEYNGKKFNYAVAFGRIARDIPELRKGKGENGKDFVNGFSLAVPIFSNGENKTEWFSLIGFDNVAKNLKRVSDNARKSQIEQLCKEYGVKTIEELLAKDATVMDRVTGVDGKEVYIEGGFKEQTKDSGKIEKSIFIDNFKFANSILGDVKASKLNKPNTTPNASSEEPPSLPTGFTPAEEDEEDDLPF